MGAQAVTLLIWQGAGDSRCAPLGRGAHGRARQVWPGDVAL